LSYPGGRLIEYRQTKAPLGRGVITS